MHTAVVKKTIARRDYIVSTANAYTLLNRMLRIPKTNTRLQGLPPSVQPIIPGFALEINTTQFCYNTIFVSIGINK